MSLKGGIKTAVLREAYKDDQLIDKDPLLEIKDKFVELLEEGWQERAELLRLRREQDFEIAFQFREGKRRRLLIQDSSSQFMNPLFRSKIFLLNS
ncbi:Plant organelle RNA recognition domain - like 1 [Theobroma cacao]|nr:Plant organelle RNA recognition domain - like 1 [Theobroma cacao]